MKTIIAFLALLTLPMFAQEKAKKQPKHFDPVKKNIEGWTVWVEPKLLEGEHAEMGAKALSMLGNHLERITILLPEKQLKAMKPNTAASELGGNFNFKCLSKIETKQRVIKIFLSYGRGFWKVLR